MGVLGRSKNTSGRTLDLRRETQSKPHEGKPTIGFKLWMLGLILIFVATGVTALTFHYFTSNHKTNAQSAMQKSVIAVGKLILVPKDETPTFGTVSDITKLKGQTFFKNAANGDELLIYQNAKLSILYRSSINKLINVGPLVVGSSGSPYVTSNFAIKNGTNNSANVSILSNRIKQLYPNATITSTGQASRLYQSSITIDLTKNNQPLDEQIADSLGVKAGQAPLDEPLPTADVLVIIGADFK